MQLVFLARQKNSEIIVFFKWSLLYLNWYNFQLFLKSEWKDYIFILCFIYFIERGLRRSEHSITEKAGKASMDRASLPEFLLQSNWQILSTISSFLLHAENSWRQRHILKNFIFFILHFRNQPLKLSPAPQWGEADLSLSATRSSPTVWHVMDMRSHSGLD